MALFIAIMAGIVLLLAIFKLVLNLQEGEGWRIPTGLAVIAVLIMGLSIWKLPFWSGHDQTSNSVSSQSSTSAKTSAKDFSANFSDQKDSVFDGGKADRAKAEQTLKVQQMSKQLRETYADLGQVTYTATTKTWTLTITDKDFNKAVTYLSQNPGEGQKIKWPSFVTNMTKTSQSIQKNVGSGYTWQIKSSAASDSIILRLKDGKVTQNLAK
ncbi:hypothetical protein [Levilactobacillus bambusae]|uniref:DUF308 domain-containing protein n=1 Tax=Levilactobacillus bambusae TaxID=2024736 RepID=A0A2V1N0V5_9LACO|nr:hypothetical protein [Levilactobacillus bambusae]PWG00712.1 hypothetical protein DCM90_00620 [Levilactobacillus bambusae]